MIVKTGIVEKIEQMIVADLTKVLSEYNGTNKADVIDKYRDANFLGGQYDYIFDEFEKKSIKEPDGSAIFRPVA